MVLKGTSLRHMLMAAMLFSLGHQQRADAASVHAVSPEAIAREVMIYRDVYGVPHVFGKTDASTVFGFAYAQAEDNFWRIEDNYLAAIGRSAEVDGERRLERDRRNRALGIPRLAREEYKRLDPHTQSLCDAFAAGLNYYLERHPQVKP